MDTFVQWIALIGIVVIAVFFVAEIVKWRSIGAIINRRQRILRVILIVLIEGLFGMMLAGPWVTGHKHPLVDLVYWFVCTMLCLAVVALAMVDLREVLKGYLALNRRVFGDLRGDALRQAQDEGRRPQDEGRGAAQDEDRRDQ